VGYVVQLLLVALYMSTYDDALLPDQHAVSAHLTTHHARNGNIISNHRRPPPPVNQLKQHKERLSRPQGKHTINPHLS
jgi:hypothetical protein